MAQSQKRLNIFTIYLVAVLQMGGVGLSPILKELSNAFPQYSATTIQFVMTMPSIFVVVGNLFTGWLCEHFPKKYIVAIGCGLAVVFAILATSFHNSLYIIYVWAAVLGVASSFSCTVSSAILNEMFEPDERIRILGVRAFATSVGSMIMTFVGGILVSYHWYYGFLVYLIAIPGLVATLLIHPKNTRLAEGTNDNLTKEFDAKALILPCFAGFATSFLHSSVMVNASMLVAESGYVDASTAAVKGGILSTVMLSSGGIAGLFMGKLSKKIGIKCIILAFILICIGHFTMFLSTSYPMFLIAAFISGFAITLVMPHVQVLGADAGGSRHELALSITILTANLGTLISPLISSLAKVVFGTSEVRYRFVITTLIAAICCCILAILIKRKGQKNGKDFI